MSSILELAIKCMDAAFETSPEDAMSYSDVLTQIDTLIMDFRNKYEIPNNVSIGNADGFERNDGSILENFNKLEIEVFNICWDHMQELMLYCGLGEIAGEVLDSELTGIKPSWERKADNERKANSEAHN